MVALSSLCEFGILGVLIKEQEFVFGNLPINENHVRTKIHEYLVVWSLMRQQQFTLIDLPGRPGHLQHPELASVSWFDDSYYKS